MTRLQADMWLLFATVIWGSAFVAQKDAFDYVGPFTFIAARFALSALTISPLAWRERRREKLRPESAGAGLLFLLCAAFGGGMTLQQIGIGDTSTVNAGFLTGLYAIFTPLVCLFVFRQKLPVLIFPAAAMSVAGIWLLSGGGSRGFTHFGTGDAFVLASSVAFAAQIVLLGQVLKRAALPFQICWLEYAFSAVVAGVLAVMFESPSWEGIVGAAWAIAFAGILSGGVSFTIQGIAMQYTPASDSAVILSAEAVFAALAAILLRGEELTAGAATGGALIIAAILVVELGSVLKARKRA